MTSAEINDNRPHTSKQRRNHLQVPEPVVENIAQLDGLTHSFNMPVTEIRATLETTAIGAAQTTRMSFLPPRLAEDKASSDAYGENDRHHRSPLQASATLSLFWGSESWMTLPPAMMAGTPTVCNT